MWRPETLVDQRILISPLNWGWGHVARCIPLIRQLQEQGNAVFVACSAEQEQVFREYLEDIECIAHAGYPFDFRGKGQFALDLFRSRRGLKARLINETAEVEKLVEALKIDLVISDHRYGFRSRKVPSIFITHQVNLPLGWWLFAVQKMHGRLMEQFNAWWIMDFADQRLAGKLSQTSHRKALFIGAYSRFSLYGKEHKSEPGKRVLVASGPEIYARQFRLEQGQGEENVAEVNATSTSWRTLDAKILSAETLVARSGYSTIMDLYLLGKMAELSPTPGQAEQIYLYTLHGKNPVFRGDEV